MKYKNEFTFEERLAKFNLIKSKNPDFIPIIVEKYNDKKNNDLKKNKFLVSKYNNFSVIPMQVRKHLTLDKSKALFFYINNKLINQSENIEIIYNKYKDTDGFLYVYYEFENTFG